MGSITLGSKWQNRFNCCIFSFHMDVHVFYHFTLLIIKNFTYTTLLSSFSIFAPVAWSPGTTILSQRFQLLRGHTQISSLQDRWKETSWEHEQHLKNDSCSWVVPSSGYLCVCDWYCPDWNDSHRKFADECTFVKVLVVEFLCHCRPWQKIWISADTGSMLLFRCRPTDNNP